MGTEWVLLETIRTDAGERDEYIAICSECGRALYAAAYYIAPLDSDGSDTRVVGIECCKKLTGYTPTGLAKGQAERAAKEAKEEEERERQTQILRWIIANQEVVDFITARAEEAEETYLAAREQYYERGGNIYPRFNEFWQSLLDQITSRGTLSERQMDTVRRVMSRDQNAELPEPGQRVEVEGPVIHSVLLEDEYASHRGYTAWLAKFDILDHGLHWRVPVRQCARIWDKLGLVVDRCELHNKPIELRVKGTVKHASNGLVILVRCTVVDLTNNEVCAIIAA